LDHWHDDLTACVDACRALSEALPSHEERSHRSAVLLRFLRVTKDRSLLQTKLRIEICRRERLGQRRWVQRWWRITPASASASTTGSDRAPR
jgi:hypothetical protein